MDHCRLGFLESSRQVAVEALFYLAYHTQLKLDEITGLIDLIKRLTNGQSGIAGAAGGGAGGIGGLPLLDPFADSPDPYVEDGNTVHHNAYNYGGAGGANAAAGSPYGPKLKGEEDWTGELVNSLWRRGQVSLPFYMLDVFLRPLTTIFALLLPKFGIVMSK